MYELVTLGETMAVIVPNSEGALSGVESFCLRIAGAESNTAIGVSRLGHSALWISALGDDEMGRYVRSNIAVEGVDVSAVVCDGAHRTGLMLKEFLGETTNVYYYRENSAASHICPSYIPKGVIESAKIVHLTGITPVLSESCHGTVLEMMARARSCGAMISFDPNIRRKLWRGEDKTPMLREMLEASDIVLMGLSEAEELYGMSEPEELSRMLLSRGVKYVVIKDGGRGAYCSSKEEFLFIPPISCDPVDSVGAGDGFNAGFLSGILEGKSLLEAGRMGAVVGAMATETVGDVNGYPTRDKLKERMEKNYE